MKTSPGPDHNAILCIEPRGEICLLLSKMLESKDIHVTHAAGMEEVLSDHYFEAPQPALIIVENTFAEGEIAHNIAAIKERAPASKVLMVSSVDGDIAKKALIAGVDDFLTKPFTKSMLLDTVLAMVE